ncbi:uncharacterized protein ssh isoform X2 [Cherax quadricarinatus]|uniref:uncharacterized protein ssh isoform X2 n=1 Tax=Cherax quadricarinatus TaxID=27406 RepID=UPI0023785DEE|nr:uncharacterized protein LOC128695138 isoform X2 [Cherax quadricarinatus]
MALVTIQRSPSVSSSPPSSEYGSSGHSLEEEEQKNRSLSEYYFAVKGFGVLLPKNECQLGRGRRTGTAPPDIQGHLQAMLHLLCPGDTLHMAVRLESQHVGRVRYLAVTGRTGRQDKEEDCLLGIDFTGEKPSIGLVLPVLADTRINLNGDGSALQTLHKSSSRAQDAHYFLGGVNHDWVGYYERGMGSDQSCINEWNAMDSLESKRPPSPDSLTDKEETQLLIRSKLKEIMMSVDIDEVTSKYIRQRLEEDLAMNLFKFKSYIDQEMLVILGQMDAATEIFPHVYLGSEWNASNLDELQSNGVGYILNVTKEIDNFYPGTFDYLNIRVYDDEKTELLKHWDSTFRYISQVKEKDSKVLVHCKMGISRSASVVIAYAMKEFNMTLEEALALVKKKRTCIKPNQAFCNQLKTYEGILDASRQRHNILWRSKSETNLKSASAQANKPNVRGCRNSHLSDDVDHSKKGSRRKSTEEMTFESTSNSISLRVPTPCNLHNGDQHRRPKSWSPDDHTAGLLFPQNMEEGGNDLGDSWRLSQSLNVQSWRAHVTLQQRDLRDMSVEGSAKDKQEDEVSLPVVEALNPLYTDNPTGSTINEVSALQLSSSVKDRINEFENVQSTNQTITKKAQNVKKGDIIHIQNTVTCSDDFNTHSSTAELDKVIETLLAPGEDLQDSEPVVSQTKPAAQKLQAVLVPSQIWLEEKCEVEENMDITESPVGVTKESVTWPAGIVKRQKQDFEEKVKINDVKSGPDKEVDSPISRQSSSGSLSGQLQKVEIIRSPSYGRQDSVGSDIVKRDDPFSVKLDKVFDREERKQQRMSTVIPNGGDVKDTPSRNSSWGSFDSAVVLADRDTPSRQSSWGSCDTRGTVGTIPSRNSSFGTFDIKQQPLRENLEIVILNSNLAGTYFEKDPGPFSPGTIRRNKGRNSDNKEGIGDDSKIQSNEIENFEDGIMEDAFQCRPVANVKAYGPAPYKSPIERVTPMEITDEGMVETSDGFLDHHQSTPTLNICIPDSTNPSTLTRSQPNISCTTISLTQGSAPLSSNIDLSGNDSLNSNKRNSVTEEVPLPGTVKQHKELLESKSQEGAFSELRINQEKLPQPTYTRSQSYCDLEMEKTEVGLPHHLGRSFSEKRAKFEGQLESETEGGKVKKITRALEQQNEDDKIRLFRMKGIRKRSHSLERLSTSPTSPGCSPRQLLEQLLVQKKESPSEEICVKSLVVKFEDPQEQRVPKVQTRSVRAKSDSSTPDKFLPPVPQRKSSLDYNFKPALRAQSQPPQTPVRQMTPGGSLSPTVMPPSHKPPPGGRGQACGTEVRQKKQQGKTHPLTKLTRTNRENYHTM